MILRPYQSKALEDLRESIRQGRRRLILCAPTGSGKTVAIAAMIQSAVAKGRCALFICHRRELVNQAAAKLQAYGVQHGILMGADKRRNYSAPVQIASVQTLATRLRKGVLSPPPADLLIVDEAHHSSAVTWTKIIKAYPCAVVIGLTATPARKSGAPLGDLFEEIVPCSSYAELIQQGFLVPTRVFAPSLPDLKGVQIVAGDYHEKQLAGRMDRTQLVGDIVQTWLDKAERRPTFVYAVTIAHSQHLCEQFVKAGVKADHVDGEMDPLDRDRIVDQFNQGELEVLCNCMIFTEGTDIPRASCTVIARPTKSLVLYRQMAGRIQRPHESKIDAMILDHSGCALEHGLPDEDLLWDLHERPKKEKAKIAADRAARTIRCPNCHAVYSGKKLCPQCGTPAPRRAPQALATKRGELTEIRRHQNVGSYSLVGKQRVWDKCVHIARAKGWPIKRACGMFKGTFGLWPSEVTGLFGAPSWRDAETSATDWYFSRMHRSRSPGTSVPGSPAPHPPASEASASPASPG